jgi:endonuclease/exonuclease/phosphatase family metal-dependent hydrolase
LSGRRLLAIPADPADPQPRVGRLPDPEVDMTRVRVVNLNLWALGGDWEARRRVLVDGFAELRADLIAFEEALRTTEYDQVAEVLSGLDMHIAQATARDSDGSGIAIASRWPITQLRELDLHLTDRTGGFPCATLAVEVDPPGASDPLLFVNHLPSWQLDFEHEREVQAVAAARFIDELVGDRRIPVVVAGDMDADPSASSIRFWTGRQALAGMSVCYRDAWESAHPDEPGHTFTSRNPLVGDAARDWPFRRIDYILVRCGQHAGSMLVIDRCELLFDSPVDGVWASDHFGVVADLSGRDAGSR